MIGQDVKEWLKGWLNEYSAMGLENIENACKGSIKKWEEAREIAKHNAWDAWPVLNNLVNRCDICFLVQHTNIGGCRACFLYVDNLVCFQRGTYKQIYDYLSDGNNTEYSDDFRAQVTEYADELIEYLREMIAEVAR